MIEFSVMSPLYVDPFELQLADMLGESGVLGDSPIPLLGPLVPPFVELDGPILVWWYWDPRKEPPPRDALESIIRKSRARRRRVDPAGMLNTFIRIREGTDVENFARRYGVLELCEHGLPRSHNPLSFPIEKIKSSCGQLGSETDILGFTDVAAIEPVEIWLFFVKQARAMLNIASSIHEDKKQDARSWDDALFLTRYGLENLMSQEQSAELLALGTSIEDDRRLLAMCLRDWLQCGDVRPWLDWREKEPKFGLNAGLFGGLGVQLLTAISRAHSMALCNGCGEPYLRRGRKPQVGRRNYCPTCGEPGANRDRQRALRERRRQRNE